eukprot:m.430682 g.430682  ORF g.430682 m.430682 type:complete len:184 (-) comp17202_c0_seq1:151-702(-)
MSLPDWVKQTCELYGLSYNDAIVSKFTDNAITLNMLPSLVDADWKELIPQVGVRTALRKAASDLNPEGGSALQSEINALRSKKDELQLQEEQQQQIADSYREQIQMAQGRLQAKTTELLDCQSQASLVMSQSTELDTKTTSLAMELESLKTQKVTMAAEKAKVEEERERAQMEARALSNIAAM